MIEYENALTIIKEQAKNLGIQVVSAQNALGDILAKPVISNQHLPPFDNSAMDGFALSTSQDSVEAGTIFNVIGLRAADVNNSAINIKTGECMQIMTGAALPEGSDRVVPVEKVEILEADKNDIPIKIKIIESVKKNANVRFHGEDVVKDDCVLQKGVKIKSAHLAMLAAIGANKVTIIRRPKVALICTGNELVDNPKQKLEPGQIRNSNAPLLCARIKEAGADVIINKTIGDDTQAFNRFLNSAKEKKADIIISCGAVSMGEFDFIPEAVKHAGGQVHFHKAAIRPGKPIFFASLPGNILYFGLPGNPVSGAVGLRFFVTTAMRAQLGLEYEKPIRLALQNNFTPHPKLHFFLKAKIEFQENGAVKVRVLEGQQSFKIRPLLDANCWISVPAGDKTINKGELVDVYFSGHLDNL